MNKDLNEIDTFAAEEREAIASPMRAKEMVKQLTDGVADVKVKKW